MEEYSEQEYLYIRGFLITNMRGGGGALPKLTNSGMSLSLV